MRRTNQEKLTVAVLISKCSFQFIPGVQLSYYTVPEEVKVAGFQICADELGSIVEGHDLKKLEFHGGVGGIADKLSTSTTNGLTTNNEALNRRQEIYGINKFAEAEAKSFWVCVWEALQDMTLMVLGVCAFVSLIVGIATEGWPKGALDGLGIAACILLVVFVTATSDYRQYLQFRDLDKEKKKKKISIQVTRGGHPQKMSIYDLLPGDIIHLAIGDQVPADGLCVSGSSVLIDESSLTGESEPVIMDAENPFLLSGTKVQDGSCKMMVTTVGMRTRWGKLMATPSEGGDVETPLRVKLKGVATIIQKICLFFAVVTFAVLVQKMFGRKLQEGTHWSWSGDDALKMLKCFDLPSLICRLVNDITQDTRRCSLAFPILINMILDDRHIHFGGVVHHEASVVAPAPVPVPPPPPASTCAAAAAAPPATTLTPESAMGQILTAIHRMEQIAERYRREDEEHYRELLSWIDSLKDDVLHDSLDYLPT